MSIVATNNRVLGGLLLTVFALVLVQQCSSGLPLRLPGEQDLPVVDSKIDENWDYSLPLHRVWGGPSPEYPNHPGSLQWGISWTLNDPEDHGPSSFREAAGLPDKLNAGTNLTQAVPIRERFVDGTCGGTVRRAQPVRADPASLSSEDRQRYPRGIAYGDYTEPTVLEVVVFSPTGDVRICFQEVATKPLLPAYGGPPQ